MVFCSLLYSFTYPEITSQKNSLVVYCPKIKGGVYMFENEISRVSSCSETEVLSLVYYFYQMSVDIKDLVVHEECQNLFNALVEKLGLGSHVDAVLSALIKKQEKENLLTQISASAAAPNPFRRIKGKMKFYLEDEDIYSNCGLWVPHTKRDVNLIRVLFSSRKRNLETVLALSFFVSPGSIDETTVVLPKTVPVPNKIRSAVNDVTSVQFLIDSLKINLQEARILLVAYRLKSIKEMFEVCDELYSTGDSTRLDMYSRCANLSQKEVRLLLKRDQKLSAYGLIDDEGKMDVDAIDAISEKDLQIYFSDVIKKQKSVKSYELNSFSVSEEQSEVAVQLLKSKNSCNILLYGAPGAGKTEYAKSLIKKAGQKMSIYNNELEIDNENSKKALPRLNCYLSLKKDDSVLIVDEAETILQTKEFGFFGMELSSTQKGTVNKMLENSENKVIWIVNYTNEMDESTLRRFNYSIKFQQMPKETLRSIAASKLKSLQIPSSLKNEILDMCSKYKVTGASVDYVVKTINSFEYQQGKDDVIRSQIKSVLEANSSLLNGKNKMRDVVKKSYDLSILNTSIPANDMVDMLRNAEEYKKENLTIENNDGVRMLFYGLSGTGKTELARYISQTLEKPLLLKRCSDLLGSYVGQTERQIRAAFEEAENTNSILLFDEADSFFADRTTANQSWERTQVNEFLTQMEEFSGICICTTNLRQIMDPAMQRRFHIISEFKALEKSGIQVLLEKYFSNYEFSDSQIRYLASYDSVTPGDFGSLSGKIRFIPKEKISSEYIINELVRIQEEKSGKLSRKIGFAS